MAYTTINKSTDYFNTKIYTGNASTQAITGVGFQPDWLWIKNRSTTNAHNIFDAVRGTNKKLDSANNTAENTSATNLTSFDSDGFTLASNAGTNGSGNNLVSWNWKAGGSGSTNYDGATASTVSANTTSGFSIVTHAGTGSATTIGHGLGAAPKVIITKGLNVANSWIFSQNFLGGSWTSSNYLYLNSTAAVASSSSLIDNVTNSTISFAGSDSFVNGSYNYVHYCFAEKTGYSKFGSYVGNNNTNGTFVYTGFKPAWILAKAASGSQTPQNQAWVIWDNKRSSTGGFNENSYKLYPNVTSAEATSGIAQVDILSNGFKFRNSTHQSNSNNTYLYMAFAEAPIVGTNNIPATAR